MFRSCLQFIYFLDCIYGPETNTFMKCKLSKLSLCVCLKLVLRINMFLFFRHAALMAISAVGEGCHKQMEDILKQIMDGVVNFLQDPVSIEKNL